MAQLRVQKQHQSIKIKIELDEGMQQKHSNTDLYSTMSTTELQTFGKSLKGSVIWINIIKRRGYHWQ